LPSINEWCRKTFEIVELEDYLDKLLEIYPAELPPSRSLPPGVKNKIAHLYQERKFKVLINTLLDLKKYGYPFPIEHPYASLLGSLNKRKREELIERNPKVVETISKLLITLGPENIIKGLERPKDINRAMGAAFKRWVRTRFIDPPFNVVNNTFDLLTCKNSSICIYAGPDEKIGEFIREQLRLLEPEEDFFNRDIIARVKDTYVIGEARFLSTPGGSQTRDLKNTLLFLERVADISKSESLKQYGIKIRGVVLLDGIVWFYEKYVEEIKNVAVGDRVVMSALLLRDYLLDVFNKGF
jgi:hypothetical protein